MIVPNGRIDVLSLLIGMKIGGGSSVAQNVFYCECETSDGTIQKNASCIGGTAPDTEFDGMIVFVRFKKKNTKENPTLRIIPCLTAYPIKYYKRINSVLSEPASIPTPFWGGGDIVAFVFRENAWWLVGPGPANMQVYGLSEPITS